MKLSELFIPKWKHPDEKIRAAAVNELTDQSKLEQVVLNEKDRDIRCSAFRKLTNQHMLSDISLSDPDESCRYIAATSLHDEQALFRLIQTEPSARVREAAFRNLTDETKRLELVQKDNTLKELHRKLCKHKYIEVSSHLDMTDYTDVYTLVCSICGHEVETAYPNQCK